MKEAPATDTYPTDHELWFDLIHLIAEWQDTDEMACDLARSIIAKLTGQDGEGGEGGEGQ